MNDELAAVLAAQERDRTRVCKVLHHEVGQLLTAAGFHLDALRLDFGKAVPELAERTAAIQSILESAMTRLRELSTDLNPSLAQRIGLIPALQRLVQQARERGLQASLEAGADSRFPDPPAASFYTLAVRALDYAFFRGAGRISFGILTKKDAYVLEVLYDVASPDQLELMMSPDLAVRVTQDPRGTVIRAIYFHGTRGSAG